MEFLSKEDVTDHKQGIVVSKIKQHAEKFQQSLNEIANTFLNLSTTLASWNMLSPVGRLPPEMLLRIFKYAANATPSLLHHTVTHVCHRWRCIALDASCLWQELDPTGLSEEPTSVYLARSREVPLTVTLQAGRNGFSVDHPSIRLVLNEFPRIRHLTIHGVEFAQALLSRRYAKSSSCMESLVIDNKYGAGSSRSVALRDACPTFCAMELSSFHTLRITGLDSSWWRPLLCPCLRSLAIIRPLDTGSMSVKQLLLALANLPHLEDFELELGFRMPRGDIQPKTMTTFLPRLRNLSLAGRAPGTFAEILNHAGFPHNTVLVIAVGEFDPLELEHLVSALEAKLETRMSCATATVPTSCMFGTSSSTVTFFLNSGVEAASATRILRFSLSSRRSPAHSANLALTRICKMISTSSWASQLLTFQTTGVLEKASAAECHDALIRMTAVRELRIRAVCPQTITALLQGEQTIFPHLKCLGLLSPLRATQTQHDELFILLSVFFDQRRALGSSITELLLHHSLKPKDDTLKLWSDKVERIAVIA